jgi:hypothetical protein
MIYATGAATTLADRLEIDEMVARAQAGNFGLRSLVHEIVQSRALRRE